MNKIIKITILLFFANLNFIAHSQSVKIALLKYNGGGDWYANPTSLTNLIRFCNTKIHTNINPQWATVQVGSKDIFNYPFVHLTGHGNIVFNEQEKENLRNYLLAGGFLHIDDNYGMDKYIRREMKKVFPNHEFVELPFEYPIYNIVYPFPKGLPKVHQHDNKSPQGFGIIINNRLVCFYSYETDLGDGWEDASVHNDPEEVRLKALKMGANLISFTFSR